MMTNGLSGLMTKDLDLDERMEPMNLLYYNLASA